MTVDGLSVRAGPDRACACGWSPTHLALRADDPPRLPRLLLRPLRCRAPGGTHRRPLRAPRADARPRTASRHVLPRHEAEDRDRPRARARPAGAPARRARDGARPRDDADPPRAHRLAPGEAPRDPPVHPRPRRGAAHRRSRRHRGPRPHRPGRLDRGPPHGRPAARRGRGPRRSGARRRGARGGRGRGRSARDGERDLAYRYDADGAAEANTRVCALEAGASVVSLVEDERTLDEALPRDHPGGAPREARVLP